MSQLDRLARAILTMDGAYALRWAQEHTAKRRRVKAKSAPRRKVERASKAQRAENWQTTREAVLRRANGRCELCFAVGFDLDCHHLGSGPLRTKYESPASVIACCRPCHRGWHQGAVVYLEASLEAASRIGCPDIVMASLSRRLQKATR